MKITFTLAAAVLAVTLDTVHACCSGGCFCIKGEGRWDDECKLGPNPQQASLANYGHAGNCLDTSNFTTLSISSEGGCGSSNADVKFYTNMDDCNADPNGEGGISASFGNTSGDCVYKDPISAAARVVCN